MLTMQISREGDWASPTQLVRLEAGGSIELFVAARPGRDEGDFEEQARSMYHHLGILLRAKGAFPSNVIKEKVFLSNVDRQFPDLKKIRGKFYNGSPTLPSTTYIQQPPARPGRLCELQAYVKVPAPGFDMRVTSREGMPEESSCNVVEHEGYRHLYLTNLTGGQTCGEILGFKDQAREMLIRAESCLNAEGFSFGNVIRTWFYVNNLERDYADFNQVRRRFYREQSVMPLPASTGIQGATYPTERGCAMDLYAITGGRPREIEVMHAPTLNEAPSYGAWFSRGIKLSLKDRDVLFVSGTASIDSSGKVIHKGDIEGQVHRMFLNVQKLLSGQGATMGDIVTGTTYLKHKEHFEAFYKVCRERSIPMGFPNTVTFADVCRPDWLCEIEVTAVCSK